MLKSILDTSLAEKSSRNVLFGNTVRVLWWLHLGAWTVLRGCVPVMLGC